MNIRERKLALLLLGVLLLVGGGIIAYPTLLVPINERKARILAMQRDIDDATGKVLKIKKDQDRWDKDRVLSLPANVNTASVEYGKRIRELLSSAGFSSETTAKMSEAVHTTTVGPTRKAAKPVLTRLTCIVTGRADLEGLVRFLEAFYKMPLLHQVRSLSVQRPTTAAAGADQPKPGELVIKMNLEAVILDGAEDRAVLLPRVPPAVAQLGPNTRKLADYLKANFSRPSFPGKEPPKELAELLKAAAKESKETIEGVSSQSLFSLLRALGIPKSLGEEKKREALATALAGLGVRQVPLLGAVAEAPPRLASVKRNYASIGGLNVFLGPRVEPKTTTPKSDYDFMSQIVLTDVTIQDPSETATPIRATIYDRNRNRYYRLVQTKDGKFKIEDSFLLRGREIKDYKDDLELEDPDTGIKLIYQVIKIELREVILRHESKYYSLTLGYSMKDAVLLPEEALEGMGVVVDKPAAKKPGAKPSSDTKPVEGKTSPAVPLRTVGG